MRVTAQQVHELLVQAGRLPVRAAGEAVDPCQHRRSERKHGEGFGGLRLQRREQRDPIGRRQHRSVDRGGGGLDAHRRRMSRAREKPLECLAPRRAARRQDPIVTGELLQRNLAQASERMLTPGDDDIGVGEQELLPHVARPIRAPQHAEHQVEVAAAQRVEQRLVGTFHHVDGYGRIGGQELVDRLREKMRAGMRDVADGDAGREDALHRAHLLDPVL